MNKLQIFEWLEKYEIKNYTINDDLTIDVDGEVILDYNNLKEIPFKFNIVNGYFSCSGNQLESLNNCPNIVNGNFWCHANKLTSLEGCPKVIKGNFYGPDYLKNCKEYKVYLLMKKLLK